MDELRAACLRGLPPGSGAVVRLADKLARRWLERSASPYTGEVVEIARLASGPGAFIINTSYEWACTVATPQRDGAPMLVRTLDWTFPGLGRGVTVARQRGPAGEFWNVTWPGAVGVLTAVAPGRFAATINQAPLYRRTRGELLRPVDYALNGLDAYARMRHAPPAHVLRQAFEAAADYAAAQRLLTETPVARPVLFSLIGTQRGEACVIERTATEATISEGRVLVANDWQSPQAQWEARSCGGPFATDSRDRCAALASAVSAQTEPFAWLWPPVHNWATRLAVEMSAADGMLRVIGFEPVSKTEPARQATLPFELIPELAAA